jgi:hypothetical protein
MSEINRDLTEEELKSVAGSVHPLEFIPGIGQYVTAAFIIRDAVEQAVDDVKEFLHLK